MNELSIPKIGNAAGTCNSLAFFEKLLLSAADTITYGPMSVLPREKNAGTNFYTDSQGRMVNSMGLPSEGIAWYEQPFAEMQKRAEASGKSLALTVPPIDPGDIEKYAETCMRIGVRIVEINGGCWNVWKNGKQKRVLSFDPEGCRTALETWFSMTRGSCISETRFKCSPYSDPFVLAEMAEVYRPYDITIVTSNTFANACMFRDHDHRHAIEFGKHLGGYGGRGMKPVALGQVAQFHELLPHHRMIGVSGIENGRDMWEYVQVGAREVQVGTAWYWTEDPRIFGDILSQYTDIIETD